MEFRARYITIGVFTLGVIAAVFAFVYWLNNIGGLREQSTYEIRFQNSVSGLVAGSGVLFNGIRVGEVIEMKLDPKAPSQLSAVISINKTTPIRKDTRIAIDYQGLTGGANILLRGVSADSPVVVSTDGAIPVLLANLNVGQSWTQAAGDALARINKILDDNGDPLNGIMKNLNQFTAALARNSDKVDGIVAGLERMTGGSSKGNIPLYDLVPADKFEKIEQEPTWHVVVSEPTVLLGLNTDKILLAPKPGEISSVANAKWTDNLPNLFQTKLVQSFENAGYLKSISKPAAGADGTHRLLIDIRSFQLTTNGEPKAVAEFIAKIHSNDGKIVATKKFSTSVSAKSSDASGASVALGQAFAVTITELVAWTAEALKT
ncbi:MAG: ABC-type transport auxiliary lipoprotein family protein [Methyloligellaceae bacterium]